MTAEQLYALATKLEADGLSGVDGQPLTADDIFPMLEALDERGADLLPALEADL
jgi:hypothetical protein